MRVVELVAAVVAQPEPPAADVVPADGEERPVRDGEERRPQRRDEVLAVVPLARDVGAERAEGVAERGGAEDGEHVAALREACGHLRGGAHDLGRRARDRAPGSLGAFGAGRRRRPAVREPARRRRSRRACFAGFAGVRRSR